MICTAGAQGFHVVDDAAGIRVAQACQGFVCHRTIQQPQPKILYFVCFRGFSKLDWNENLVELPMHKACFICNLALQARPILPGRSHKQAFAVQFRIRNTMSLLVSKHLQAMFQFA